jgi:hypothetical protein
MKPLRSVLVLAFLSVLAGAAHAASIEIDATGLVYRYYQIPGITPDWLECRSAVRTLEMPPGTYHFQVASGYFADFTFEVTAEGKVDYPPAFDGFLEGRDSSRLTIKGFEVTLDARYLSNAGILLVIPTDDWILHETVRMVPASHYRVQQGSGILGLFKFALDLEGHFQYDPALDVAAGGFLAGHGTSTLEFLGYPLLIDARADGGDWLLLNPIWGMPLIPAKVQYVSLLPAARFIILTRGGVLTTAEFSLQPDGTLVFDEEELEDVLRLDTFHGLRRLKVLADLPLR